MSVFHFLASRIGPGFSPEEAHEWYRRNYGFKRGVRPASPDRDPVSYDALKKREVLNEKFYGTRTMPEIKMIMGHAHGFRGARTVMEGHSVYGKCSKDGHRIGARKK